MSQQEIAHKTTSSLFSKESSVSRLNIALEGRDFVPPLHTKTCNLHNIFMIHSLLFHCNTVPVVITNATSPSVPTLAVQPLRY